MFLQDISLPPDIRDNLERCAAALEAAAVAAGATLPGTAARQQRPLESRTAQPQLRKQAAIQPQPDVNPETTDSGAAADAADGAIKLEAPSDAAADATAKGATQQGGISGKKKKKRKHGQPAALAAPDAQPAAREKQPAQTPAVDAPEQAAGQPGRKKHKKRQSTSDADVAGTAIEGSAGQAGLTRGTPADATEADAKTPVSPKKKWKKDRSATAEQQDQPEPHVQQAVNGTGRKQKNIKKEVGTTS
jgi:hypothetical protein